MAQTELTRQRNLFRGRSAKPIWLSGSVASVAAVVATILLLLTTGAPAYAVTQNPDGTVTVTLNQAAALAQAAAALHSLGAPSAVGCVGTAPIEAVTPGTNTVVINPKNLTPGQVGVLFAVPRAAGPPRLSWHVVPTLAQDCAAVEKALANVRKAQAANGGR
ncbi:MAG TPA: hypothetical protein VJ914_37930 [Pseudonocardiaceae bacterium]|nr:hypothetical protein [Pseudonocardiaceae bacterium]